MKARPSWLGLVASVASTFRQARAFGAYSFDPKRVSTLRTQTLLLTGGRTASPQLKLAIRVMMDNLPNLTLIVLDGQEHNAMDTDREQCAGVVVNFLLGPTDGRAGM